MAESLPLVLLHGWGFDHHIWDELIPRLREHRKVIALDVPGFGVGDMPQADPENVTNLLLAQLPPRCVLLGWSLGGMLATHLAIHHPRRVAGLITVGSNLKWVATDHWPGASADNFAAFFENLAQHFESTKQHFCGVIARGDGKEKIIAKQLRTKLSSAAQENFIAGLQLLDRIDNRAAYTALKIPGLHIFGEKDVMVPLDVGEQMKAMNSRQPVQVMSDCAHQPFLSQPENFASLVLQFVKSIPYQRNKKQLAQSFSKAATTYDSAAQLQREIGDQLFSLLPAHRVDTVLDLGSGTGVYSHQLQKQFSQAKIISLDIAIGMLQVAKQNNVGSVGVCADAEHLPFKENSMDIIFSNLAVQWCQDYEQLFLELKRVLKPGGVCVLSTFQEGTLRELKAAWQSVDDCVHVNEFTYAENLRKMAMQAGLSSIAMQHQTLVKHYAQVKQLTQELKAIGAHNINQGRPDGLTSKRKRNRFYEAYEQFRCDDKLPAHYEIVYLTFTKE